MTARLRCVRTWPRRSPTEAPRCTNWNGLEEALANSDSALALRPDFAEALANRANALHWCSSVSTRR